MNDKACMWMKFVAYLIYFIVVQPLLSSSNYPFTIDPDFLSHHTYSRLLGRELSTFYPSKAYSLYQAVSIHCQLPYDLFAADDDQHNQEWWMLIPRSHSSKVFWLLNLISWAIILNLYYLVETLNFSTS